MFEQRFAKETELYLPLKSYFTQQGFAVKGEVKDCDLVAEKDGLFLVAELKLQFNVKLLFQVAERLELSPNVVVALPDYAFAPRKQQILKLMSRLAVGIYTIALRPSGIAVKEELALNELKTGVDAELKKEFLDRSLDLSPGTKIVEHTVTAYKEKALAIAILLSLHPSLSIKEIKLITAIENVQSILYNNYDGFFQRSSRGVYALSDIGAEKIKGYPQLLSFYQEKFRGK